MNDNDLDALLAPPPLTQPASLDRDLAALVRDARRPLRTPRLIAAGVALTLALGGATAAAASGLIDWSPWAQQSPSNRYVLPSGIECEFRIGAVTGDPDAVAAANEIIATTDFVESIDIDAALAEVKASRLSTNWDTDRLYNEAVATAANRLFFELLTQRGYSTDGGDITSAQMEGQCPGAAQ